jgi:hypothetical protein
MNVNMKKLCSIVIIGVLASMLIPKICITSSKALSAPNEDTKNSEAISSTYNADNVNSENDNYINPSDVIPAALRTIVVHTSNELKAAIAN